MGSFIYGANEYLGVEKVANTKCTFGLICLLIFLWVSYRRGYTRYQSDSQGVGIRCFRVIKLIAFLIGLLCTRLKEVCS